MKRLPRLKTIIILAVAAVLCWILSLWIFGWPEVREAPSLLPEASGRMAGLRFDPAYFYGRGVTARELAAELVPAWRRAGIDTILFRAYDPAFGANYRTGLQHSKETDYGRQDLLGRVIQEARSRGMKVYAWLAPLHHAGAWEAMEDWRVLRKDGAPHKDQSLPFPLCPRQPGVRAWWLRFVGELLDRYPELDGVDLAEPVLSWRETEACFCSLCAGGFRGEPAEKWCEYRAGPLTDLVIETLRSVRARGKETMVTTVLPADAQGNPLPFAAIRDQTGLDLDRVLASPGRPRFLSVEVMWQEWAAVWKSREVFGPEWARKAIPEARRRAAGKASVIAHLELSDSGDVRPGPEDLRAGLVAALEAGAEGFEVYDAALLERKGAGGALRDLSSVFPRKKVLVLHHPDGESDARQLATLCGHFAADAAVKPIASYAAGDAKGLDALFYIGIVDGTKPGEAFLRDAAEAGIPVLWLSAHIQELLRRSPGLGFEHAGFSSDPLYGSVRYRDRVLLRKEPQVNIVRVADPSKVQVLAEVVWPQGSAPYALRSGNLWYFADDPLSYAMEGGTYAILADLLHDVLGEDHAAKKLALVRLEDVHPLTPPEDLRAAARLLRSRGVPFLVSLVPFYTYPEKGESASLDDQPEFVEALKDAVRLGGTVVLHGVTHQREGESTADYEFWDEVRQGPPEDRTDAKTRARLFLGLGECLRHGIYPLLWETPHYAAPQADYRIASQVFSAAIERRQSEDRIGSDQLYPYAIRKDRYGQLLLPENLGYVPLEDQKAGPVLVAAERTAVVRDATVGFFFHLFCERKVLQEIVDGLIRQGFSFPDVRTLPLAVAGPDFRWCTTSAPFPADPPGIEARLLDARGKEVWRGPPREFPREKEPALGIRVFLPAATEVAGEPSSVPRLMGQEGLLLKPLQVGILAAREEAPAIEAAFRSVSAPCSVLDLGGESAAVPAEITLVVVSEAAGRAASPAAALRLKSFLEGGGTLLTWGRTPLAEELGIHFTGEEREVRDVEDSNYPGAVARLREPRRVPAIILDGNAEVLAEAREVGKDGRVAVLAAMPLGDGKLLHSGLPPFEPGGDGPYPFLFSALRDYGLLAPFCRSKRLEVYYDYSQREETVSIENLVKGWAREGVRTIHASGWYETSEWTYDYDRLIELAHQNAMLVHAWLIPPLVSEKFWKDHPEWREKNPRGEDASVGWRKEAMSLVDPACREAVKRWIVDFLGRHPFDGVTLAGLSFGGESFEKPETLSPFSEAARKDFREKGGFDPRELFDEGSARFWKRSEADLRSFLAWRKGWTSKLHRELIELILKLPAPVPRTLTVSLVDAAAQPEEAELAGVDVREVLRLRKELPFRVQFMDPGDRRPWGAERFRGILRDYAGDVDPSAIDFQVDVTLEAKALAAGKLTGGVLYQLLASAAPQAVAVYSEDAIADADWPFLASALAPGAWAEFGQDRIAANSPQGFRLSLDVGKGFSAFLDGKPWQAVGIGEILVPPGERRIELRPVPGNGSPRVADSSCAVLEAEPFQRGIRFVYESRERAWVLLSREAVELRIDGQPAGRSLAAGERGHPVLCPPGRHEVAVVVETWPEYAFRLSSVAISRGIVILGGAGLGLLALLFLLNRLGSGARRAPARRVSPQDRRLGGGGP